jgi:hypothetical protein
MATIDQIENVRRITNGAEGYTDQQLNTLIDSGMSDQAIAYRIWNEIAASTALLVNTSESGSSRSLSDLHKNALTMAANFAPQPLVDEFGAPKRTRKMIRG